MVPEIAFLSRQIWPTAIHRTIGIEESPVPLGQMALSPLQEIGADDVVEANGAGFPTKSEKQRQTQESLAELLDLVFVQIPQPSEYGERDVYLWLGSILGDVGRVSWGWRLPPRGAAV
jgi:hypothetical protein